MDGERLVGGNGSQVRRVHKLAGRHDRLRDDDAHRDRVAASGLDLLAVGEGKSRLSEAEVAVHPSMMISQEGQHGQIDSIHT